MVQAVHLFEQRVRHIYSETVRRMRRGSFRLISPVALLPVLSTRCRATRTTCPLSLQILIQPRLVHLREVCELNAYDVRPRNVLPHFVRSVDKYGRDQADEGREHIVQHRLCRPSNGCVTVFRVQAVFANVEVKIDSKIRCSSCAQPDTHC